MRYWLSLHPDIKRPIGGVKQMHRLAEAIQRCGHEAILIQESATFHPGWFQSSVKTISLNEWKRLRDSKLDSKKNVLIIPETFLNALSSYSANLPVVIFNQNGSYSFGLPGSKVFTRPEFVINKYHSSNIAHVLCVSRYDHDLLVNDFSLGSENVSCIRNGIENHCFPAGRKRRQIAYMPRKNKLDAFAVVGLLKSQAWMQRWELIEISDLSHDQVIDVLRQSILFLSFGHPEGFGLPVAEAMACGCAVVGYSGLGGRELFRLGEKFDVATEVPFGDWSAFIEGIRHFDLLIQKDVLAFSQSLLSSSKSIRRLYSQDKMIWSVQLALERIEKAIL